MEELYTCLGYILIAILLYLILKTIINKRDGNKEGFMGLFKDTKEDSKTEVENETVTKLEENIKNLQDATDKSNKQLDLGKTRKQWEEMIVAMEDRINSVSLQSVSSLADMIKDDPDNSKLVTIMDKLNTFTKYRDTLKENMKYLDGLK
jgi:hypothetical protein|tara:strand:- start:1256 stop:1702 length:447 start_codon:yes stop_codon:yes gene_type:complete